MPTTITASHASGFAGCAAFTLFVLFSYVRISGEDALQSRVRALMCDFIRDRPGSSFSQVRRALGLENGVAAYHLEVLEDLELVHSESRRGRRWYYANGNAALWRELPVSPLQESLLSAVRLSPGIGVRELARALGRSASSVAYNVKSLEQDGLLRTERQGIRVLCSAVVEGDSTPTGRERARVRDEQ